MHWQFTPYTLPLLTATAVSAALALFAWRRRSVPGAIPFVWLMLAVAEWSLAYALELGIADLPAKILLSNATFLGIIVVPTAWLAFVLQYTGREKWLTRRNLALLAIEPLIILLLAWTNDLHHLFRSNPTLDTSGSFPLLDPTYSTAFWVHAAYSYPVLLFSTFLLIQALIRSPRLYRRQATALLIGALAPWVANTLHISGLGPFPHLDLTPFAFTLTGLALAWGLFRFRLLDIVPVARDAVVEGMSDGVIVLDVQNRIVDLNPAAGHIIGCTISEAIGQPIAIADLGLQITDLEIQSFHSAIHIPQSAMTYDLRISPLLDRRGRLTGRLVVLRDVTERQRMEELVQKEKKTFFSILQKAPYGMLLIDKNERCLYVNPEFTKITGHTLADIPTVADWFRQAYPDPAYRQEVIERWKEDTVQRISRVFSVVCKRGEVKEVEFRPTLLDDGRAILALSDITKRKRAEEALRESEERYVDLYDNAPDMYFTVKVDGTVLSVNRLGAEMLGYQKEELIGKPVTTVFHPDDAALVQRQIDEILKSGKGVSKLEFRKIRKDGSVIYVSEQVSLQYGPQEEPILRILCRDTTERKQAEEEIQQRTTQLEALRQVSLEIAAQLDLDDLLHSIVSQAVELLGGISGGVYLYHPERDVLEWRMAIGPNPAPIGAILQRGQGLSGKILETGEPLIVNDYRHWEGHATTYEGLPFTAVVGAPVRWGKEFLGVLNVTADGPRTFSPADAELLSLFATVAAIAIRNAHLFQAERKQRRRVEALAQATAALASTLDLETLLDKIVALAAELAESEVASILLPGDRTGELWFRAATNYSSELGGIPIPIEGSIAGTVFTSGQPAVVADVRADPQHFDGVWQQIDFAPRTLLAVPMQIKDRSIGVLEALNKRSDQGFTEEDVETLTALATQAAMAVENARLFEETRLRAEELAGALIRLKELDRLKDEFIQNVSHELRTPLALIRGYAEMLDTGELGELQAEQREPVAVITRRARMLNDLVQDITLILEAESGPPELEPVPLDELTQAAVKDFYVAATQAGLTLHAEIAPDLPPVSGSPISLRRVLDNLLGNAVKFTPVGGTITVQVRQEGEQVALEVNDTGIGVPSGQLERIFERFYQVDGSTRRKHGGVGLGLALVKEIVETCGGRVTVESQVGQGSAFTVLLPIACEWKFAG